MYVKSTLARADSLSAETDQYKKLTENIAGVALQHIALFSGGSSSKSAAILGPMCFSEANLSDIFNKLAIANAACCRGLAYVAYGMLLKRLNVINSGRKTNNRDESDEWGASP